MSETIQGEVKSEPPVSTAKHYGMGLLMNGIAGGLLALFAWGLELELYVYIALGMQLGVFLLHGLPFNSEKLYDLSGSATHFAVVAGSLVRKQDDEYVQRTPRQILISLASVIWMTRLGSFLYLRISKDGKDERFDEIKQNWFRFMGMWTIQAAWVSFIQVPVVLMNDRVDKTETGPADYVAAALWLIGFVFEAKADNEKFCFRSKPENRKLFINEGVWTLCRHPNYFGEILMWTSIAISVTFTAEVKDKASPYFAWISPGFTAFLLLFVSGIPMVAAGGLKKWGHLEEYQHYLKNTSMIIPWFPAKAFNKVSQDNLVQNNEDNKNDAKIV